MGKTKLKIGLIGTHETGKTTFGLIFAGYLKSMDYSANLVSEAARMSPFGLLEDTTMETEMWIINQQINNELATSKFSDILVCDRTSLDTLAYSKYVLEKNPTEENKAIYELINKIADLNIKSYDIFIYFPITEKLIKKRGKKHNEEFKQKIDAYLNDIIREKNIDNLYKLKSKSLQGRLDEAIEVCSIDKEAYKLVSSKEIFHSIISKNNKN